MSDYHILRQSDDKKTLQVVFHIALSELLNAANVSYRTALVEYLGTITSMVPNHATDFSADEALLQSGALYEYVERVGMSTLALSNAEKRAEVEARFAEVETDELANIQVILEWWGYDNDV
jgi:hypothetical protein